MPRTGRIAALTALVRALRGISRPGEPGLNQRLSSLPRLLRATMSGDYTGTSRGRLAMLTAAVLYVVSPVDLVPELVLPLVGLVDDAVLLSWIAATLLGETDTFLRWERGPAGAASSNAGPKGSARDDVVPGHVVR